jgi:hypothetical protein
LGTVTAARRSRNQATRKPGLKVTVSMPANVQEVDCDGDLVHGGALKVVGYTTRSVVYFIDWYSMCDCSSVD